MVKQKSKKKKNYVYEPFGVELFPRLRLQLSHQFERKFIHGFVDTQSQMCYFRAEVETAKCFLFWIHF